MDYRPFGRTGRLISSIGLGTALFGREVDEDTSFRVMDYAFEKGITYFDTAQGYEGPTRVAAEVMLGRWLRSRGVRDRVFINTKIIAGGDAATIERIMLQSLERMGIERVDCVKMHLPFPKVPISETLGALTWQVKAGRASSIGCSNYNTAQLREALAASAAGGFARFEAVQVAYNLAIADRQEHLSRFEAEQEMFPLCRREEIAITTYAPLGSGFFAGAYASMDRGAIPRGSRFDLFKGHTGVYFTEQNFRILDSLREKAEAMKVPMVRLAMAWVMSNRNIATVIIGADNTAMIDNAFAAQQMRLAPALRAEMSAWGT
ncbi:MAG: aldo/keto reductase [SAR202 cluster bacterium]|nr:aldo/keto reductase [SAR202 cluster bacterium]